MKRKALVALVLGTAFAVAPAAIAAPIVSDVSLGAGTTASFAHPNGVSQAEYRAMMIRGEALNRLYGNAVTRLSPQQFKVLYQAAARLTPQELVALTARGQALEQQYAGSGTSVTLQPDVLGGDGGASARAVPSAGGDSFAWGTAAIGAAALAGVMLLAAT